MRARMMQRSLCVYDLRVRINCLQCAHRLGFGHRGDRTGPIERNSIMTTSTLPIDDRDPVVTFAVRTARGARNHRRRVIGARVALAAGYPAVAVLAWYLTGR